MANLSIGEIGAIGGKEKVHASGLASRPEEREKDKQSQPQQNLAYMNIGSFLNGSVQPPTDASAVRA